ncbi:ATP-dependent DNA helicase RecG [Arcanobacterium wilhelmae]|uniref:ATP-dependent DNA helicase RecG n=1 Tax=Arcanobacterium wilhelmae TaxID=1803177 RepID=A0ABT9NAT2_9ACTO|nr:ATP-binding protein [Arcanobacterium wilhelmae]MDP9800834.1 ATP-dependent DNA helicase RecG [Arcanobacterium wilhelmae]WFN90208.1 ATP-binding protein [Arcanobacterium wilhelmae]
MKAAQGGLPENLGMTVCAFANMPEGGTIILGVAEPDFKILGLTKLAEIEAGIASVAQNAVSPSPTVVTNTLYVDGKSVVVAYVHSLGVMFKPAMYGNNPYLRQADGDYIMPASEQRMIEIAKLVDREVARFEMRKVPGSRRTDLNSDYVDNYVRAMRRAVSQIRDDSDEQILERTCVTQEGSLSLAGLYGLGTFPQGIYPSLGVTVAVRYPGEQVGARTKNLKTFYGPLPELFDQTMDWIRQNIDTYQSYTPSGDMTSVPELPLNAIREAVANALVHRDLGPDTVEEGKSIDIWIEPEKLIISSPGGLKSLTVTQLLSEELTRVEVNQHLYRIAKHITDSSGNRIIEGEGGGVQAMMREMDKWGIPRPTIVDTGVKVTVIFPRGASGKNQGGLARVGSGKSSPEGHEESLRSLTRNAPVIMMTLGKIGRPAQISEIAQGASLTVAQTRYAIGQLIAEGFVIRDGGQGDRTTTYHLP